MLLQKKGANAISVKVTSATLNMNTSHVYYLFNISLVCREWYETKLADVDMNACTLCQLITIIEQFETKVMDAGMSNEHLL